MSRSKNFWASIPRVLCEESEFAARHNEKCWNGSAIDSYHFNIIGDGVRKQTYNPEFQTPNTLNASKGIIL